ncbi:GNAT family N-acetyltransferase [Aggregatimonas sangjinii]|uniref:GNAT family N-acetyltransferase n=1 Tax=Aggregatimonas sangjinii TaxID=2583587 RepID=A0A5B7SR82_9FLAO|nr:GNAT family N-acetyltransferase [Aggregatimonas sangjinii]QCW99143.1 GNAT family N-acetyltransferase [Aggregatimonas sangjinii]
MGEILVRKATLKDLEVLLEYEQGVIEAERPYDPTLAENPILYYDLPELISSSDAEVVVGVAASRVIGCGYALIKKAKHYLDHEEYAYLGFMYTHPDFRGNGVNSKILDVLKSWATEKEVSEIRLTVYDENASAIRAYEKYGFKKHIIEMRLPG